jgi:hypothetical protein
MDPLATCLLNLTDARGPTIDGLSLYGADLGKNIHGMATNRAAFADHEDNLRIERCQVTHFSGDGLHLEPVWVQDLRHSMIAHNKGDGVSFRGWDAHILDNWLSDNDKAGYAARFENEGASVTFTANRIEWNKEENMLSLAAMAIKSPATTLTERGRTVLPYAKEQSIRLGDRQSPATSFTAAVSGLKQKATTPVTSC